MNVSKVMMFCVFMGYGIHDGYAYIHKPIHQLKQPVKIVAPHKIHPPRNNIYTPDRYSCFMRRTLKYCHDRHGNPLNGVIVNTYGTDVAYETYKNGYQTGITSIFNESGILMQRVEYKKGVRHGQAITYYSNGNPEYVMQYDDGALDGHVEQYDINGGLVGKMTYKKGWFKSGYCKNESDKHNMNERLHESAYNEIIPCGTAEDE